MPLFRNVVVASCAFAMYAALATSGESQTAKISTERRVPVPLQLPALRFQGALPTATTISLPALSFNGALPAATALQLPALQFIGTASSPSPILDRPTLHH